MNKRNIYLDLLDLKTLKTFRKYFKTEFERDKFARKLEYSKKLKVLNRKDVNYE